MHLLSPTDLSPDRRRLRRHRFYRNLLLLDLFILACLSLPAPFNRLAHLLYGLLLLILSLQLRETLRPGGRRSNDLAFRLVGLACLLSMVFWSFTPLEARSSGLPLLLLITGFIAWSLQRLILFLSEEKLINQKVLMGAVAGYVLLGLTAGMVVTVLETVQPGSFLSASDQQPLLIKSATGATEVPWNLDFVRLTYYAFVCLSTLGFGDILPKTPPAQMFTVLFIVVGPLYIAVVMGILISRLTVQESEDQRSRPLTRDDP
ncbi:potassium channel family protein [Synechococcus sp. CS-1328]|uniref:potassium channel family protein n=1 Tax=Synechococcus sp. CS-1328 TaxID=2847976 RepID=UPI00223B6B2D|nr:potassium channel family protein [Synechococcus sp. CS-1328]MCT0223846.1 potassium channel family protein [Synechococcus sp. CS-1328]